MDINGRRQGKGRCVYGAAADVAESGATAGGRNGGSYSGNWEADEPHGQGERHYGAPGGAEGKEQGRGGSAARNKEDMAMVTTAFGPECPAMASYRGDFKLGVREGNGVCSFFEPVAGAAAAGHAPAYAGGGISGATHGTSLAYSAPMIPDSYDGQWVGGRPSGRGILSLRAAVAGPSASTTTGGETRRTGSGGGYGGSIEGVWTEKGLTHGREKLLGKGGVYEGQYRLGKREGHGRLELPDGSEYEGEMAWL